jgi:hypothetical protein
MAGQVKPETDARLSDRIAVGLLTRTFPPVEAGDQDVLDAAVAEVGQDFLPELGRRWTRCGLSRPHAPALINPPRLPECSEVRVFVALRSLLGRWACVIRN